MRTLLHILPPIWFRFDNEIFVCPTLFFLKLQNQMSPAQHDCSRSYHILQQAVPGLLPPQTVPGKVKLGYLPPKRIKQINKLNAFGAWGEKAD